MPVNTVSAVIWDTAANINTTNYPPSSVSKGTILIAIDTHLMYVNDGVGLRSFSPIFGGATVTTSPAAQTSTTGVMSGLSAGPGSTSTTAVVLTVGQMVIPVLATTNFVAGLPVLIGGGAAGAEILTVASIQSGVSLTMTSGCLNAHAISVTVVGGYGLYQPSTTGRLVVTVQGSVLAGATAATITLILKESSAITAVAPAANAAFSGTTCSNTYTWVSLTGVLQNPFVLIAQFTGLAGAALPAPLAPLTIPTTAGVPTPYWFDIDQASSTSTLQILVPTFQFVEE